MKNDKFKEALQKAREAEKLLIDFAEDSDLPKVLRTAIFQHRTNFAQIISQIDALMDMHKHG